MLASERSSPPNQIGRPRIRSLTTNPVGVTFADRKLVDADDLRTRRASVLLVQRLDRVPVQSQFVRHVLDRRLPAASPHIVSKALGVERIVRQKLEPFPFHLAATAALDPPHFQFEKYPSVPARQIAYAAHRPFRLTKNAVHCRLRSKTRERVCIPQPPSSLRCPCHPPLMPNSRLSRNAKKTRYCTGLSGSHPEKSPTRFREDP